MIGLWTCGLLRRRGGRLTFTAIGVAVAVALLATLGSFVASAQATMTHRAAARSVVDWQVQVQPQAGTGATVLNEVRSTPIVRAAVTVDYAHSTGLTAKTSDTAQATGPGLVLGVPSDYSSLFHGVIRPLAGADRGVLVAQQAAANLHVKPGDTVQIGRAGLQPVAVVVNGVIDLPTADQLFQNVGAPPGTQSPAPPDNVVLVGRPQWHEIFDPLAAARPDLVFTQIHASIQHDLPSDPGAAYRQVAGAAHNLEARSAGGAVVGDNLGATLAAARSDAAYAQILFLFLGAPAVVLAGMLTATVVAAGVTRRRGEQALLRARGATTRQLLRVATAEAAVVGVGGAVVGLGAAVAVGHGVFGTGGTLWWTVGAVLAGMLIAGLAMVLPAWRDLRRSHAPADPTTHAPAGLPAWARWGLDIVALATCVAVFLALRHAGYQLVLAPEGTPTISVSYWAFAAPALLWVGAALLTWRLADLLMGRGKRLVGAALRPLAGPLAPVITNTIARRRRSLASAMVLLALATAFAGSTAVFNATYRTQAEVDALLTNGADVTVTEPPASSVPAQTASSLSAIPGVRGVERIQHRFAYIGADLQDLFGVNPDTIGSVTALQNNYFQGGTAKRLLSQLAAQPNSILVSAETVKDYQLRPGDTINLRLTDTQSHQPVMVPFRYIGVVSEFPTAPKDSFFVANSSYVAAHTGSDAVGAFLIDTGGRDTGAVAARVRALVGTSAIVTDIATVRGTVGSSLTAVDLGGLSRIELGFGLLLAAAAAALVLVLRLGERRRNFAIATALGAGPQRLRAFVVADAVLVAVVGLACGSAVMWAVAAMLVALLKGVFDPPPEALAIPWWYLGALVAAIMVTIAATATVAIKSAGRAPLAALRGL
ncbi:ABC transporter permease [Mycobacterium sp. ENV421]|uniref:FtsX-like permease family protein n=1 Tax=Mycobacterium sp. ENV421 TaxID=1213407 RepID=UPI000C9B34DE|nr:FtsX-like permease family protein [Mycobacterium sp. ENV421]PND57254.1 ABC transporter permease [Mycobacterium sp. ENV421]